MEKTGEVILSVRISKDDAKRLDKFVSDRRRSKPREKTTRATVLREWIWRMIDEHAEARS